MFLALIPERVKTGSTVAVLAGGLALVLIAVLTFNVTRETRLLGSASSDNIQWSLAQTEVELLVFAQELTKDPINLDQLRQSFDVFYSRITTVRSASVFHTLRATSEVILIKSFKRFNSSSSLASIRTTLESKNLIISSR